MDLETCSDDTLLNEVRDRLETKKAKDELLDALQKVGKDYSRVLSEFDSCRAALAYEVKKRGISVNPPKNYDGAWHEYLIKMLAKK
ncbi:hypothetical protein LCGC14_1493590 [marine sediment metagenome]|uniref:Uncharacterized protein n=1 Tax=marine sediment metagenome TaxID=412755 RepID=A0A0F9LLL0_9ZZZZ